MSSISIGLTTVSPLFTTAPPVTLVVEDTAAPVETAIVPAASKYILLFTELAVQVPVVIRSAFISPVASLAVVVHCMSTCQLSPETTGSVKPVTSVSVELFVITKSVSSFSAKSQ